MVGNTCMFCHANWVGTDGGTLTTVGRQTAYGGIHGNTWGTSGAWYSIGAGKRTAYRFIPGTWMKPSPTADTGWNATTAGSCYFNSGATDAFSSCTTHAGSSTMTGTPIYQYGRPTNY
jgi:hypothetical protein